VLLTQKLSHKFPKFAPTIRVGRLESHPLGGYRIRTDPALGDNSPVIQHDDGTGLGMDEATEALDRLDNKLNGDCEGR
jgi:hypothetical protein